MKVIFLGTPDFAKVCLDRLLQSSHEVVAVVTQPDRERNRRQITFSPVKEVAIANNIKVLQYEKISKEGVEELRSIDADIMVTSAYGQILSEEILSLKKHGVINTHASLLPKYRGSSPIQWCVINGEESTGITIMQTAKGVDCGDIIIQEETKIGYEETAGELFDRLAVMAGETLVKALDLIEDGKAIFTQQEESKATKFPMLDKSFGLLDFNKTPTNLFNFVKGVNPWPSAFSYLNGKIFKIWKCLPFDKKVNCQKGEFFVDDGINIACKDGYIKVIEVQLEGGKRMSAEDFARSRQLDGVKLTSEK